MKLAMVVPTIRPQNFMQFCDAWKDAPDFVQWVIIQDTPQAWGVPLPSKWEAVTFSHAEIDRALGDRAWIISSQSAAVGAFGFRWAYQNGFDYIGMLHDDCFPDTDAESFFSKHLEYLQQKSLEHAWIKVGIGEFTRGFPYQNVQRECDCYLSHGLWLSHPDYDGPTELLAARHDSRFDPDNFIIPRGQYFPFSDMNFVMRRDLVLAMYMPPMGEGQPYWRQEDTWPGIFVKKICDHLGYAVHSGLPFVNHIRASKTWENMRREAPGLEHTETLWRIVDNCVFTNNTIGDCYWELASYLKMQNLGQYWDRTSVAMKIWLDLLS